MEVRAKSRFVKLSPQKARDLVSKMRGLHVSEAFKVVNFNNRKAARLIARTLKSAVANAVNNMHMNADSLFVKSAIVEEGPRFKRYWSRARGGVSPIRRRLCHINIVLTDGKENK